MMDFKDFDKLMRDWNKSRENVRKATYELASVEKDVQELIPAVSLMNSLHDKREFAFPTSCLFEMRFPRAQCATLRVALSPFL